MRRACAILLLVGARAAGVAPAETLASAVPAEKKNPIDAVEATYGSVWKSKFYGAFVLNHRVVLHTIDATPARWRGDRFLTARPSQDGRVIAESEELCTRRMC